MLTFCPKWGGMFAEEDFVGCGTELMSAVVFCAGISWAFLKTPFSTELPTDWPDSALTDDALEISMAVPPLNKIQGSNIAQDGFACDKNNFSGVMVIRHILMHRVH